MKTPTNPLQPIQQSDLTLSSDELSSDLMTKDIMRESKSILQSRAFYIMMRLAKSKVMTTLKYGKHDRIEVLSAANAFHELESALVDICSESQPLTKKKSAEDHL